MPPEDTSPCWNGLCVAGDCDGTHHVDATGAAWAEPADFPYCPVDDDYCDPRECTAAAVERENRHQARFSESSLAPGQFELAEAEGRA